MNSPILPLNSTSLNDSPILLKSSKSSNNGLILKEFINSIDNMV